MITWNTISRTSDDNVTQGIYLLETLSRDESIPILEFLRQKGACLGIVLIIFCTVLQNVAVFRGMSFVLAVFGTVKHSAFGLTVFLILCLFLGGSLR